MGGLCLLGPIGDGLWCVRFQWQTPPKLCSSLGAFNPDNLRLSASTRQLNLMLIYSASRGVGFELTRQLLCSPQNTIFATCRSPTSATSLNELSESPDTKGTVHILQLDQDDEESITAAAKQIGEILGANGRIDYLINNAGVVRDNNSPCDACANNDGRVLEPSRMDSKSRDRYPIRT